MDAGKRQYTYSTLHHGVGWVGFYIHKPNPIWVWVWAGLGIRLGNHWVIHLKSILDWVWVGFIYL